MRPQTKGRTGVWHLFLCLLLVCSSILLGGCESDEDIAETMSPRLIAEYNKPGVVLIASLYKADITVQDFTVSGQGRQKLRSALERRQKQGEITDKQSFIAAYIDELTKRPEQYLQPSGQVINKAAETSSLGTGFIVTGDGCIVTNAHVVALSDKMRNAFLARSALNDLVKNNLKSLTENFQKDGYTLSKDEMARLGEAVFNFYAGHLQVKNVQQRLLACPGGQKLGQGGFACRLLKHGKPVPGKDIAILQADQKNLPTVNLGDDVPEKTGDKIYVMGFPGAATFNQALAKEAKLEATFTSGMVSARKQMQDGWEVLQMDAAITHGNSGGPVFNEKGQVIGVATFGSLDDQGNLVQGMNFAIPVSIVREFLQGLSIQPGPGKLEENYREGVALFNNKKYEDALEAFNKVQEVNAEYPYVQDYVNQANAALKKEK